MTAALASMSASPLSAHAEGSVSSAGMKACPRRPLHCGHTHSKLPHDLEGSWHHAASIAGDVWVSATQVISAHRSVPLRMHLPRGVQGSGKPGASTSAPPAHRAPPRGC